MSDDGAYPKNQTKAVADLIDIAFRYRWRLLLPMFLVAAMVLAGSLMLPRKYRAEAIFERHTEMALAEIIKRGAPAPINMPRNSLAEEIAGETGIDELVASIKPQLMQLFIARTGRYDERAFRQKLRKEVVITPMLSTDAMDRYNVGFVAEDPEIGSLTVNTLVRNYIKRTQRKLEERLDHTESLYINAQNEAKQQIELLENKRIAFQIEHGHLLPDFNNNLQFKLNDLEERLDNARQQAEAARTRVTKLEERLATTPERQTRDVEAANPERAELKQKLQQLEQEQAVYIGQYGMTSRHPDLISLLQQIAVVQQKLEVTAATVIVQREVSDNRKHSELDLMLTTAKADVEAMDGQVSNLDKQLQRAHGQSDQLFPVRSEYRALGRQIEQLQRQLAVWEESRRAIGLTRTAEAGKGGVRLTFVKPSNHDGKPVSPNLGQVILASIGLGVLAGGVSVFSAYRTDESYIDGEQLAGTVGLPLFGSVSEIISRQQRRARRLRNMLVYPSAGIAMVCGLATLTGMLYVSLEQPVEDAAAVTPSSTPAGPGAAIRPPAETDDSAAQHLGQDRDDSDV